MKTGILDTRLLEQNISKRIQCDVDAHRISGAAVAVMQRGQLLYRNTFGYQNPEGQEPLRPDAIFRIASMTKPVTTVALLIQAQPFRTLLPRQPLAPQQALAWMNTRHNYTCSGGRRAGSTREQFSYPAVPQDAPSPALSRFSASTDT